MRDRIKGSALPYCYWILHLLLFEFSLKESQRACQLLESSTHSKISPDIELKSVFHPLVLICHRECHKIGKVYHLSHRCRLSDAWQQLPRLDRSFLLKVSILVFFSLRWFPGFVTILAISLLFVNILQVWHPEMTTTLHTCFSHFIISSLKTVILLDPSD